MLLVCSLYHVCLQNLDHIDARGMCTRHGKHTHEKFYNDIWYIISIYVVIMFSIQYHVCMQNLDRIDARGMCARHREHTNDVFYNDIWYIISICMMMMFSASCLPVEPWPHSYTRYMVHGIENITIIYIHKYVCMYICILYTVQRTW